MRTIETHEPSSWLIDKESFVSRFSSDVAQEISRILNLRNNFGKVNFGYITSDIIGNIGYANLYSTPNYTYNYLYYANQLKYAWFQFTTNDGKPITLAIADKQINTVGQFKNDNIGAGSVITGIQTALILRDKEALDFYATIPLSFTEQANQEDIIYETMMLFYQVLLNGTGTPNAAQATYGHLQSFLNWDEYKKYIMVEGFNQEWVWQILFEGRKQITEYIFLPVLNIYHQVLHNNQPGYEAAVEQALLQWKAYFTLRYKDENGEDQDHSTMPNGYLSLPIVSACAYAYDRGMRLNTIESNYIPQWLIEGNFAGMDLLVKGDNPV